MPALAQCEITGTIYTGAGELAADGFKVKVLEARKNGEIISDADLTYLVEGGAGQVVFDAPRLSTIRVYAEAGDYWRARPDLVVPDAAAANLEDLIAASLDPVLSGVVVEDEGIGFANPVSTFNFVGTGVSAIETLAGRATITISAGGGGSEPGGADTQVQFNDGGTALGGNAGLTYDKTSPHLTITHDNLLDTNVPGFTMTNTTPATALVPVQHPPTINFVGELWDVDDVVSKSRRFRMAYAFIPDAEEITAGIEGPILRFQRAIDESSWVTKLAVGNNIAFFNDGVAAQFIEVGSGGITVVEAPASLGISANEITFDHPTASFINFINSDLHIYSQTNHSLYIEMQTTEPIAAGVFVGETTFWVDTTAGLLHAKHQYIDETFHTFSAPELTGDADDVFRGDGTWAPVAGGVTSVAMTVPAFLSVAGSPITTSGTLAVTLATETANTVFAGPSTGAAAAPTFRALVAADVSGLGAPFDDATAIVKGSADPTKLLRFEVDGFTTATTRVATFPDANITVARIDAAQTFTGVQTFASPPTSPGAGAFSERFGGTASTGTAIACTAIGQAATAAGDNSTAVGRGASTGTNIEAVALGAYATAGPSGSIAIGLLSSALGSTAVAIGKNTNSSGGNGIAIGSSAVAGGGGVSIGVAASTNLNTQIGIGYLNGALTGAGSISIGASLPADAGVANTLQIGGYLKQQAGITEIYNGTAGQWGSLKVGTRDAGTATITDGLYVGHQSTGTPAAGLGSAIQFNINSSTTADQNAARIAAVWTTATHASRAADLVFSNVNAGAALAETFRIKSTGYVILSSGSAIFGSSANEVIFYQSNLSTRASLLANNVLLLQGSAQTYYTVNMAQFNSVGKVSWTSTSTGVPDSGIDTALMRNAAGVLEINNGTAGQYRSLKLAGLFLDVLTFATLPATPVAGQLVAISDSNVATFGTTITAGGGANKGLAYYDGTNWTFR